MDAPDGWLIPLVLKILSPSSTTRHPSFFFQRQGQRPVPPLWTPLMAG